MHPPETRIEGSSSVSDEALSLTHTLREASRHGERAVLLCSFQKEESVLIDELLRLGQGTSDAVRIVTIDTGRAVPRDAARLARVRGAFRRHDRGGGPSNPELPWSGPEHCCSGARWPRSRAP